MDVINQRKHMRERTPTVPQVILQPHKEGYDIEDYIQASFEKVMHTSWVDPGDQLIKLIPLLMGKALTASNEVRDNTDYKKVKAAILWQFEISPEEQQIKLRSLRCHNQ